MSETKDIARRETSMPAESRHLPVIVPLVDIYENDNDILLYADMPGVEKEDISVNLDNGKLDIRGYRKIKTAGVETWREFGEVEYRRSFSVPQTIDTARVNAEIKDGVLQLTLPKSEAAKPRRIEIKAA